MSVIAIPSGGPSDWQRALADPQKHWRPGASAMTLAACWEASKGDFPAEVRRTLEASAERALVGLTPLLVVPEYGVSLPGGSARSTTDVFVLARGEQGLAAMAVEGKVNEPFGPTVGEKRREASPGQCARLAFLMEELGLRNLPDEIRYQLLHRTASARLAAKKFGAGVSVMLVHSFSPDMRWFDDFACFAGLFGIAAEPNRVCAAPPLTSPRLYIGWCCGDLSFTEVDLRRAQGSDEQ
ncbi:MAG: hypothetical protein FJX72_08100 [Armatimonadetes bacterium]|nr:hypothetical protein [Armatimonadota bacterium]